MRLSPAPTEETLVTDAPVEDKMIEEPIETGWYAYSGGAQAMIFHLRDTGQWSVHHANGSADNCVWSYIEQALGVWQLVRIDLPPGSGVLHPPDTLTRLVEQWGAESIHDAFITRWPEAALPAPEPDRPEVVTLCGSTRFKDQFITEQWRLSGEGIVVLSVAGFGHVDHPEHDWTTDGSELKRNLDALHFRKIEMSDRVHVIDVDGYIGESTAREIGHALSLGKPITYLSARTARNPYLPEAPADGQHIFGDSGTSYRCSRCGVYNRPDVPSTKDVLDAPCLGGWAHSGKMRYAAEDRWKAESA